MNSTAIELSWSAPITTNGILLNYTILFISSIDLSNNDSYYYDIVVDNSTFGYIVTDLNEDTEYIFYILADTIAGSGDFVTVIERTFEDRK